MHATDEPRIRLEGVSKLYDDGTTAVHDLSLDVRRELAVLVGPSGCGKTTTMKMVNRLIEPTSGRVLLDGEDVALTSPVQLRRRVGYVIQQVGLFPHPDRPGRTSRPSRVCSAGTGRAPEPGRELLDSSGSPRRYAESLPVTSSQAGSDSASGSRAPWPPIRWCC